MVEIRLGGEVAVLIRDGQTDGAGIDDALQFYGGSNEGTKKQQR